MHFDDDGRPCDFTYLSVNSAFETLTGLKNVVGKRVTEVIPDIRKSDAKLFEVYGRVSQSGKPERFEIFVASLRMWLWISAYSPKRGYFAAVFEVINERKQVEERDRLRRDVLDRLNHPGSVTDKIGDIVLMVQKGFGFEAVGLRLRDGEDFPYYETTGFPAAFVKAENQLCATDTQGGPLREGRGNPVLECMCGNILCGRFDPAKPFFTAGGSFWTNSTTKLLASATEADRQARTRNRCHGEGYESVALIPLRTGDETLGLLQLNDRRPGQFTPELIHFLEGLTASIAIGLKREQAEAALAIAKADLERYNQELEQRINERTAKLRETVGELEHFSHSITHDMRAPLRAMRSFASLLIDGCASSLAPAHRHHLLRIAAAAERMDQLIADALDYSKAVRQVLPLMPVDAEALLRGMLETYTDFQPPQASIEVAEHLPLVLGNGAGLTQCFSNLLRNAVKFVEPGTVPHVRVWAERRGPLVRLWFEDNGIGIPADCQDRIFSMFQRLNREYEGTGIGLALVRKVAERMGGKVGVASEPGRGSRFWLDLTFAGGTS